MKKEKLFLALVAALSASPVYAKTITPEQALGRLSTSKKVPAKMNVKSGMRLVHTSVMDGGAPAIYVFNNGSDGDGYVFLSADDAAIPVLGYSDSGSFDVSMMPPQMSWWLDEYGRQIQYASSRADDGISDADDGNGTPLPSPAREAIAPLIKTHWDQGAPYYNRTPTYGTDHTWTGCAATSMAQVVNYWQYPSNGQGSIQYTPATLQKRLTMNFANQRFDYSLMLDDYESGNYTYEEGDAVANLMRACGYAVRMDYNLEASATLAMYIGDALIKYFNYDEGIRYEVRHFYSASEWEEMMYNNLKNVGPIIYGGNSMLGGGHSFVCDGYDGNGLFHFNWGWSGMSDGYFSLQAINPNVLGTGGGAGGGYNFAQDAVLGVQPPTGEPTERQSKNLTQMGSLSGTIEGDELSFSLDYEDSASWVSYNPNNADYVFMVKVEKQGSQDSPEYVRVGASSSYNIASGYGLSYEKLSAKVSLNEVCKTDGAYKLTMGAVMNGTSIDDWLETRALYGYYNYVVVRRQGDTFTVENSPVAELTVVDATISEPLYYGCLVTVSVTVRNDSDIELTKGFAPLLEYVADDVAYEFFLGSSVFLTVPPHQEITKEWVTDLTVLQNIGGVTSDFPMKFTIFDESTYKRYKDDVYKSVVMKANPGTPRVSFTDFVIKDAEVVNENLGLANKDVFVVRDKMNIEITGNMKLLFNSPLFAYTALACVTQPDFMNSEPQSFDPIIYSGEDVFMSRTNNTHVFNTKIQFAQAEPGVYYAIVFGYLPSGQLSLFESDYVYFRYDPDISSIADSIADNMYSDNRIYNLQGLYVGSDWDSLPKGLYIVNGKKRAKF